MAQSRLEKVGTIFTRVTGLLRTGAMKAEDKPIWYDVYAAFPPKREPRFDRPADNVSLRTIFYEEDVVRARFQKGAKHLDTVNLADSKRTTLTQCFIEIYNGLKAQGALDDDKIFEVARDMLSEQQTLMRRQATEPELSAESKAGGLMQSFTEANMSKVGTPHSAVDIEKLFKE